jgi:hypothetical protein
LTRKIATVVGTITQTLCGRTTNAYRTIWHTDASDTTRIRYGGVSNAVVLDTIVTGITGRSHSRSGSAAAIAIGCQDALTRKVTSPVKTGIIAIYRFTNATTIITMFCSAAEIK